MGNRLSMTTLAGTITYGYDLANRLVRVTDSQSRVFTYTYDNAGQRTQL
jgi:YD repeat-containing protein